VNRFQRGWTYRHPSCLDLDMYVQKETFHGSQYSKLRVIWVLQRNGMMLGEDRVTVRAADRKKWQVVSG
jgi:hypothetical protein